MRGREVVANSSHFRTKEVTGASDDEVKDLLTVPSGNEDSVCEYIINVPFNN